MLLREVLENSSILIGWGFSGSVLVFSTAPDETEKG